MRRRGLGRLEQSAQVVGDRERRQSPSLGASVTGGSDVAAYYVSGEYQKEQNVIAINGQQRLNIRTNLRSQLARSLDMQLNIGYMNSDLRRPQNDNNSFGVVSASLLGRAADCTPIGAKQHPGLCTGGADTVSHGYYNPGIDPNDFFNINTRQQVQRLIGGLTSNWTPLSWLTVNGTLGADIDHRNDNETLAAGRAARRPDQRDGYRGIDSANISTTRRAERVGDVRLRRFKLVIDARHAVHRRRLHAHRRVRRQAARRHGSLGRNDGALRRGRDNNDIRTLGFLGREQVAWADKLFLTLAVRTDRNSAFGVNFTPRLLSVDQRDRGC